MTRVDDFTIVRRTPVPGSNRTVITAKRSTPHAIRKFTTFLSTPTSRYATRAKDFSTETAALQMAARLTKSATQGRVK